MLKQVYCKNECGFTDEFEPDEFGVNYFQAIGKCPQCDAPTVYDDGTATAVEITFQLTEKTHA